MDSKNNLLDSIQNPNLTSLQFTNLNNTY